MSGRVAERRVRVGWSYLRAAGRDGDSEQVHGHGHSRHHADEDEMARAAVDPQAVLFRGKTTGVGEKEK